jgi:hypothetical protein
MRCPVCSCHSCTCTPGEYDREVRASFNAFAARQRRKRVAGAESPAPRQVERDRSRDDTNTLQSGKEG